MKDVLKVIVAIIAILILWKVLKLAIGLVVALAVIGLIVLGVAKLLEGQKRIK